MSYQKYNDPAKLLLDICKPNWNEMAPEEIDDLLAEMSKLGLEMSQDKKFKHDYVKATKELYLSCIHKQNDNNYIPPKFTELDKQIRQRICEHHAEQVKTEVLIPEYNTYAESAENMAHAHNVKAQIAVMRANLAKKNTPNIVIPKQRK